MRNTTLAVLAILVPIGCGDDGGGGAIDASSTGDGAPRDTAPLAASIDSPPGGPFTVTGTVTGSGAMNPLFVAWSVTSGSPDVLWKFGEGSSTATTFMVTMSSDPPAQAINSYGVAVGIVAMSETATNPPDGDLGDIDLPPAFAPNHSIIWRSPTATGGPPWSTAFPAGYSCGQCVRDAGGFDTFTVTACSNTVLVHAPTDGPCDWT